jgi:hypothetical protein
MSRQSRSTSWVRRLVRLDTFWGSIVWSTLISVLIFVGSVYLVSPRLFGLNTVETPLEARIDSLSSTLSDAARTVDEAEREIRARQELVERLRQDQQRYEQLKRLDQAQVDAVAATLQGQLAEAERQARLAQWLLLPSWGALLGLLFTLVHGRVTARRLSTPPQSEGDAENVPPA